MGTGESKKGMLSVLLEKFVVNLAQEGTRTSSKNSVSLILYWRNGDVPRRP